MPTTKNTDNKLFEVARRIKEMRSICDFTVSEMAEKTEVSPEQYPSSVPQHAFSLPASRCRSQAPQAVRFLPRAHGCRCGIC